MVDPRALFATALNDFYREHIPLSAMADLVKLDNWRNQAITLIDLAERGFECNRDLTQVETANFGYA